MHGGHLWPEGFGKRILPNYHNPVGIAAGSQQIEKRVPVRTVLFRKIESNPYPLVHLPERFTIGQVQWNGLKRFHVLALLYNFVKYKVFEDAVKFRAKFGDAFLYEIIR